MPCSGSTRLNHHHLMRQEGWLQAKDSRLWDTWRHRTQGSAAAPTGGCGGSRPLPEREAEVWRSAPVGHMAAPDPGVGGRAHRGTWRLRTPAREGERRSRGLRLAGLMTQASWRSGFHL